MKKLFAGPFCGEFGWEVMTWQSYLRGISSQYDYIVVCAPTGHEVLYSDFCDKYVPYDAPTLKADMWRNVSHDAKGLEYFKDMFALDESNATWLTPDDVWRPLFDKPKWEKLIGLEPRKFVRFGDYNHGDGYDIVYHARHRDDWDSGFRDWNRNDCSEFLDGMETKSVACIGRTGRSYYCGGDDLRDIPLSELAGVLSASKVLIGPISGPVHFGTLCGIRQVTWATKPEHGERVIDVWNPFNVKVDCICADDSVWRDRTAWVPDMSELITLTNKVLNVKVSVPV